LFSCLQISISLSVVSCFVVGKGISQNAMSAMNSLVNDILDRVATEAVRSLYQENSATMTMNNVQTAVRSLFPAELATHAIRFGQKAIQAYTPEPQADGDTVEGDDGDEEGEGDESDEPNGEMEQEPEHGV